MRNTTRPAPLRRLTLLTALLLGPAAHAAPTNFAGSTPWTTVLIGAQYDSANDRQANGGPDLLGTNTHGLLYTNYDNKGTASEADDTLAYRVRIDGTPASGFADVLYIGIDANNDSKMDAFIGVDNQGNPTGIRLWDTGTGANTSPNTTSIIPKTLYAATASNYFYAPVSATNDPHWTTNNIDGDSDPDYFLNFSLSFADLQSFFQTVRGISITSSTPLRYVVSTSTQNNAINSDIGGINDKALGRAAGDTLWSSILSPAVSLNGITVSGVSAATAAEGAPVSHQITLAGQNGLADTTLTVTLTGGTATLGTDTGSAQYSLDGGTTWVTAAGSGPAYTVTLPKGAVIPGNTVLFRVNTVRDNLYTEGSETYTVTASTPTTTTVPSGTGTITDFVPTITGVTSPTGTEGSVLTHTVTLSGAATTGPTTVNLTLTGVTATIGVDTGAVESSTNGGATWTPVTLAAGGAFSVSVPANTTGFLVRVAAATDSSLEGQETYRLDAAVTGTPVAGTGTINDPGAAPVVTIAALDNTNDTTPTITGTTDAPVGTLLTVTVTQGTQTVTLTTTVQAGGTYSVTVPGTDALSDGPYTAAVSVTTAGGTGTATDPGSVDATAPVITVTAPDNISDATPTLTGTTDAPVGSTITVTVTQGSATQTLTTTVQTGGTYTVTVPGTAPLADGPYSVTASVSDTAGNTGTATDPGSVDTTAPVITVVAPDNTNDSTPTITGTTDAPAGSTVTVTVTQGAVTQTLTATVQTGGTYSVTVPASGTLADGPYTVDARVSDAAGNVGTATDPGSVDTTAPSITITAPDGTNNPTPTITGTTDAPVGSTVTVTVIQGGTTQTLTATVQTGGTYSVTVPGTGVLVDGPYTASARVSDPAGNTATATDPGSVDTTAPVITVSAPDNTNDPTPTITGTTDAPVGSTVTVTVTHGGTTLTLTTTVQTGGTYSVTVPAGNALTDGPYNVAASVSDTAGNTGTASDPGSVDTTVPVITVTAPDNTNDSTPTITGTTDAQVGSTITVTVTQGSATQTLTTTVQTGGTYSVSVPSGAPLVDGPYAVSASVTDLAGNTGTATDPGSVDATAPVITVTAPDNVSDATPTIMGTTDAPVGSTVMVSVTQGSATFTLTTTVQTGGAYSVTVPAGNALADGPYTASARVSDPAGNIGTATDPGSVDVTPPVIAVVAPDNTSDTTPTITGTTDAPVGSTVTVTVTQGAVTQTLTTTVQTGGTYSVTVPASAALSDGPYTVNAAVTDSAGNTGTASDPGSVDASAPAITVTAPDNTNDPTPTITGTTDAPVGSTVTVTVTQGGTTFTLTTTVQPGGTYSVTVPGAGALVDGPYTVTASVTDSAGNAGAATDPGSVDTTAPVITVTAPDNVSDPTPTITGTTDAPVGSTVTVTVTQGGTTFTLTTTVQTGGTYSVTVPAGNALTDGLYSVNASVTDLAGNTGTATDPGSVDTTAPVITVLAPDNTNDSTPTITGTTDAPVGSTITVTVTQGAVTQTLTATVQTGGTYSVTISGTGALVDGPYSVEARVTDSAGNTGVATDPGSLDLTAPVITVTAPDNRNDSTPTITGTTDAPVGSTVTVTVTQGGTTFTLTTTVQTGGTYSVTVPGSSALADGPYSVTASVSDSAGNTGTATDPGSVDTTAPVITVVAPDNTNDATPTITGTTDAPVGSTVTVTVTQGGTTLTLTTTVQAGGAYSVTVPGSTPLLAGPYAANASVTDQAGNTGSATDPGSVAVTPPPAPAVASVTAPSGPEGSWLTHEVTMSGPVLVTTSLTLTLSSGTATVGTDTGAVEYSLDGGLTWTTLTGSTVQIAAGIILPGNVVKVRVQALNDAVYEALETYTLAASTQTGAAVSGTGSILNTTAPLITVTAPDNVSDATPTITGTTDAPVGSTVTVTVTQGGTTLTFTTTVQPGGTYSVTVPGSTPLLAGPYAVSATVTDPAGVSATATDTGSVVVATADPVVTVEKYVRNVTVGGVFGPVADALPGDTLQYCIRFVNTGGAGLAFQLSDVLPGAVTDVRGLRFSTSTVSLENAAAAPDQSALPTGVTLRLIGDMVVLDFGTQPLASGEGGTVCFEVTLK